MLKQEAHMRRFIVPRGCARVFVAVPACAPRSYLTVPATTPVPATKSGAGQARRDLSAHDADARRSCTINAGTALPVLRITAQ